MKKCAMFLFALLFAVPLLASAQDEIPASGWYVGAGVGTLSVKGLKPSGFEQDIMATPGVISTASITSKSSTQSLLAGYSFNRYVSAEIGYLQANGVNTETLVSNYNAGSVTVNGTVVNIGNLSGDLVMRRQAKLSVMQYMLVGKLPVTSKFSLFAKAGIDQYRLDVRSSVDIADGIYLAEDDSQKGKVWVGSLGADYRFTQHFVGRLEYMPGKVVKTTTVALLYWF